MSKNTDEIRTRALVVRRTNYGEADRILDLVTPAGMLAVMARGVRREKSKLAGGIEMFTLSDVTVHQGRGELGVLTSARMVRFYGKILKDLARMELAGMMLKKVARASDDVVGGEFFEILDASLAALDAGSDTAIVEAWFLLNFARATGEQVNLYRDTSGEPLELDSHYEWDTGSEALVRQENGAIDANAIKLMRLMLSAKFEIVQRVKEAGEYMPEILRIARAINKI